MTRHLEIVPARGGLAVVETYLNGTRTAMTEPLPLPKARERGVRSGLEVIDHVHDRPKLRRATGGLARVF